MFLASNFIDGGVVIAAAFILFVLSVHFALVFVGDRRRRCWCKSLLSVFPCCCCG